MRNPVRLETPEKQTKVPAVLLLDWFSRHARPLPWRTDYDPYKILVSEFMLQQTRVEMVLPYFERWMARYPDLKSLANAREPDAEKLWEGLGYYSRCRNLLSAAKAMVRDGYDEPPSSVEILLKYPGIGPYTAGAVASIAHNAAAPAVDGNVERVASRFFDIEEAAGSSALRRAATENFLRMMPEGEARSFNQALMELGALVCLPGKPACPDCPWRECCRAKTRGVEALRPLPKTRPAVEKILAWGALCVIDGAYLLRRRPDSGLWAGFWEIPWFARETEDAFAEVGTWGRNFGIECVSCAEVGTARFSFTRYRVTAWFVLCEAKLSAAPPPEFFESFGLHEPEALAHLTLPSPSRKFLKLLRDFSPQ